MKERGWMRLAFLVLTCAAASVSTPSEANVLVDDLTRCVATATKPDDLRIMSRWMFSAFATNPQTRGMANVSPQQRERLDTEMARVVERLLSQDCRKQVVQAVAVEGGSAIVKSFETLGQMAAQQLMKAPETDKAVGAFAEKLDPEKLEFLSQILGKDDGEAGKPE